MYHVHVCDSYSNLVLSICHVEVFLETGDSCIAYDVVLLSVTFPLIQSLLTNIGAVLVYGIR